MLNEKLKGVESDMKVVLNNRKKLDSLEEIISKFVNEEVEKDKGGQGGVTATGVNFSNISTSTKYNTKNNNYMSGGSLGSNQNLNHHMVNMMSPINNNSNYNQMDVPERDVNDHVNNLNKIPNYANNLQGDVPRWYKSLKMKKQNKFWQFLLFLNFQIFKKMY